VKSRFEINYAPIVVAAEGAVPMEGQMILKGRSLDEYGHVHLSGIGEWPAQEIAARTGTDARTTVLGHVQRGGTPTAFDRWPATRFGLHAVDAVKDGAFGTMVALHGTEIVRVPLDGVRGGTKVVDPSLYDEFAVYFGRPALSGTGGCAYGRPDDAARSVETAAVDSPGYGALTEDRVVIPLRAVRPP